MENKQVKTVDQMTTEELQVYLAERRKDELVKEKKEQKNYEKVVNKGTTKVFKDAEKASAMLYDFFINSTGTLEEMREMLNKYGKIRSNSKGGFLELPMMVMVR